MLVIHYTGMRSAAEAIERLCDPAAKVSAHYLIDEDGSVVTLVPEALRAWHAGVSWWQGRANLNDVTVGIELVNPGHEWGYRPFPALQMAALIELSLGIVRRCSIPSELVLGHSDIAPGRKVDPGELFDWPLLAAAGLGCWPVGAKPRPPDPVLAVTALGRIGYAGEAQGVALETALGAFQRHYRPACCDGSLDAATMGNLMAVAGLCGGAGTAT